MGDLGIHKCCLSIEDDKQNMKNLIEKENADHLLLPVFSPVDLFTSRISSTIKKDKFFLHNDKGDTLHLQKRSDMTVTQADKRFSLLGKLQQLRKMGFFSFVVDLSGTGFLTDEGKSILEAYADDPILPGTTEFNFERGLI